MGLRAYRVSNSIIEINEHQQKNLIEKIQNNTELPKINKFQIFIQKTVDSLKDKNSRGYIKIRALKDEIEKMKSIPTNYNALEDIGKAENPDFTALVKTVNTQESLLLQQALNALESINQNKEATPFSEFAGKIATQNKRETSEIISKRNTLLNELLAKLNKHLENVKSQSLITNNQTLCDNLHIAPDDTLSLKQYIAVIAIGAIEICSDEIKDSNLRTQFVQCLKTCLTSLAQTKDLQKIEKETKTKFGQKEYNQQAELIKTVFTNFYAALDVVKKTLNLPTNLKANLTQALNQADPLNKDKNNLAASIQIVQEKQSFIDSDLASVLSSEADETKKLKESLKDPKYTKAIAHLSFSLSKKEIDPSDLSKVDELLAKHTAYLGKIKTLEPNNGKSNPINTKTDLGTFIEELTKKMNALYKSLSSPDNISDLNLKLSFFAGFLKDQKFFLRSLHDLSSIKSNSIARIASQQIKACNQIISSSNTKNIQENFQNVALQTYCILEKLNYLLIEEDLVKNIFINDEKLIFST